MQDDNENVDNKNTVDQPRAEEHIEEPKDEKTAIQTLIDLSRASKRQIKTEEELSTKPERKKLELEKLQNSWVRHFLKPVA